MPFADLERAAVRRLHVLKHRAHIARELIAPLDEGVGIEHLIQRLGEHGAIRLTECRHGFSALERCA